MTRPELPVRIGILGAARIARQFVEGARAAPSVSIDCVAAREHERARAFAKVLGVPRTQPS